MLYWRGLPAFLSVIRRSCSLAALGLALLAPAVRAVEHVPGEVVVRSAAPGAGAASAATAMPRARIVRTREAETVAEAIARLRRRPGVLSATPNHIARAAYIPDDPGRDAVARGWTAVQWNFAGPFGVNAPAAWDNVARAGRPGAAGVVVAVLDTGVAYSNRGRYARSPDLRGDRFVRGYDFVDGDRYPSDANGHGTHVASTIAESIDNGIGVTGLAFGAKLMPVRVLDRTGEGDSFAIARGIRFAARRGAHVINLSFQFGRRAEPASLPGLVDALRFARRRGVLVVAAAGNEADTVAYPARAQEVLAVGATTEHGCVADYSNTGPGLDLVAPGGGQDKEVPGDPHCQPLQQTARDIVQMTFTTSVRRFGLPSGYEGTSMAAPHVAGTAALVLASGVLGPRPSPAAVEAHLRATARDLGPPGPDAFYAAGLVDAAAATARPAA